MITPRSKTSYTSASYHVQFSAINAEIMLVSRQFYAFTQSDNLFVQ